MLDNEKAEIFGSLLTSGFGVGAVCVVGIAAVSTIVAVMVSFEVSVVSAFGAFTSTIE
jgi:hypothetical protein